MNTIPPLTRRRAAQLFGDDTGAATAEYVIVTHYLQRWAP